MIYYGGNDYRDYLAHHGVLGQKWGVRRYQPYSYTGGRKSGKAGKEVGEAKLKAAKPKDRGGSDTTEAQILAVNIALDILLMRPFSAIADTKRLIDYGTSKAKTASVNKELANAPTDKKTGLKLKTREMTKEEDMAMVNPGFKNFDSNTKNNCMLCTTAYDLRRRGYNVTANTALFGYHSSDVKEWYPKATVEHPVPHPTTAEEWMNIRKKAMIVGNKECTKKTVDALVSQGNGARGNLMIQWGAGGGHSLVYEVEDNKVILRDCQSNKVYKDPAKILDKCVSTESVRLDNIDFDPKKIKEAVR